MKRSIQTRHLVLGALLAAVTMCNPACSDGDDDPLSNLQDVANVAGTWIGATGGGAEVAMDLSQATTVVSGNARFGEVEGGIAGTIDGNRFEGTMTIVPRRIVFATVGEFSMSGTFRDETGNILDTFEAARQ